MSTPGAEEQLLLELINETRMNPLANAARYITDYDPLTSGDRSIQAALTYFSVRGAALEAAYASLVPVGPVAWNGNLGDAAEAHNLAMIAADAQEHQLPGEGSIGARATAAGYVYRSLGENIYAYVDSVLYGHAGFMVDWGNGPDGMQSPAGHRVNIMNGGFTEIGIAYTAENSDSTDVGPFLITQDFGSRGKFFVTGVAYTDSDRNAFYSVGEGRSGLVVSAAGAIAQSSDAGGYTLEIRPGDSQVITLSGAGLTGAVTVTANITSSNLKLDIVNGDTLLTSGSVIVEGPIAMINILPAAATEVTAGTGDQTIQGNTGNDIVRGGAGNDKLFGGAGIDGLYGNDGNDELQGDGGADFLDGGSGIDTAIFSSALSQYAFKQGTDGSFRILDRAGDTDVAQNIEYFRFAGINYQWDTASRSLKVATVTTPNNVAPVAAATQLVTTKEATAKSITVSATDADGDTLTFTASKPAHGTITGGTGGVFTYTPTANYVGNDNINVTISDGNGHSIVQAITVSITAGNVAPVVAGTQAVTTNTGSAKQIVVSATDADGDTLTYTPSTAAHGTVTGGVNGVFTYKPTAQYNGTDSFTVQVSDGKGHTVSQTVNVTVQPSQSSGGSASAGYRLYLANGLVDAVSSGGQVIGTNGFQDIKVLPGQGEVVFDASFNRGNDIIRLPGNASLYSVVRNGSSLVDFETANGKYTVPIGDVGTPIVFDDGVRKLIVAGGSVKIGSQTVTTSATQLLAPSDGTALPGGADGNSDGRAFLSSGGEISLEGDHLVFGTNGAEKVRYLGGDLQLDSTFNKGGDTLFLPRGISAYSAYKSGSVLVLISEDGVIHIPLGAAGITLNFNGDAELARFVGAGAMIGDQEIVSVSESDPDPLGFANETSIDRGTAAASVRVEIESGQDHVLRDDADTDSNVVIVGFDLGDFIDVTGASASDYSFTRGDADSDGVADDMTMTFRQGSVDNLIAIIDAFAPNNPGIVYDYATASAAFGGDFMTFG